MMQALTRSAPRASCRLLWQPPRRLSSLASVLPRLYAPLRNPVNLLIGVNVSVWAVYALLAGEHPSVRAWYWRNMVLRESNVRRGAFFALLGSTFTHLLPLHLLVNMMALHSFGGTALAMLGPRAMLGLYAASGLAGSLAQVNYPRIVRALDAPARYSLHTDAPAVGASGAIAGLVAYTCLRVRYGHVYILIVAVPNRVFLPLFAAGSGYCAWMYGDSSLGHASHLGGLIVGILLALVRKGR